MKVMREVDPDGIKLRRRRRLKRRIYKCDVSILVVEFIVTVLFLGP